MEHTLIFLIVFICCCNSQDLLKFKAAIGWKKPFKTQAAYSSSHCSLHCKQNKPRCVGFWIDTSSKLCYLLEDQRPDVCRQEHIYLTEQQWEKKLTSCGEVNPTTPQCEGDDTSSVISLNDMFAELNPMFTEMAAMADGGAVLVEAGKEIYRFYPATNTLKHLLSYVTESITALTHFPGGGLLIVLLSGKLEKLDLDIEGVTETYETGVTGTTHCIFKCNSDTMLICAATTSVYSYDMVSRSTDEKLNNLANVESLAVMSNCSDILYYLSDKSKHQIYVYNSNWQYVITVGKYGSQDGSFKVPRRAVISGRRTLLAADKNNHRLQEFTPEGAFIRKITQDIERKPISLSYHPVKYEYLWVTNSDGKVKRIKIY